MHTQHAQEFFVARGVGPQAHQRVRDRVAQHIYQGAQLLGGIAQQHAAACIDIRALGRQQQLQRFANLPAMAFFHRVVRAHFHALGVTEVRRFLERDIFGNVHHHGAWTAGTGNMESFFQRRSQVTHILDEEIVLDDGTRNTHGVALLESIQANRWRGHLAGNDDHGNGVHVGRGDAGDGIGQARAGSDQRHTHVACGAGVAVGSMHSRLFVAHQHVLNGVLLVQRIVDVEHRTTGVAPDVLHVFGLQGLDEDFCAHEFGRTDGAGGCGCVVSLGEFHDQPL